MSSRHSHSVTRRATQKEPALKRVTAHDPPSGSRPDLAGMLAIAEDAVILVDRAQIITLFNRGAEKIFGYASDEVVGKPLDLLIPARFMEAHRRYVALFGKETASARTMAERDQIWGRRKDGTEFAAEASITRSGAGRRLSFGVILRDISERVATERKFERLNRALRVLTECNQALVRAESTPALLARLCELIVEIGGYRFAWIGFLEHDEGKTVRPVAQTGDEAGYLERMAITWSDTARGRGPTGTAAQTGAIQVSRNIHSDPRMAPWRADALKRGYASSIAIPLICDGVVIGVLTIYAQEPDAFDEDETQLLRQLAEDLAFGIATHRSNEERRRAEARAERLANFDGLTDLPNRARLTALLQEALEVARARRGALAVMNISMDRFKEVQDALGIRGADALLKEAARRLKAVAGDERPLARVGGEFFGLVLPDAGRVSETAADIHTAMSAPFDHAGVPVDLPATIGAALFPAHGAEPDALLVRADIAVRQARAAGVDFALYSGKAESESPQHLALLAELRRAIKADQLVLFYQPKIDVSTGRVSGAEALVRWRHPGRGIVPPNEFVPLAERTGLIRPLTYWVLKIVLEQLGRWRTSAIEVPVAVNISPNNLRDPEFLDRLSSVHAKSGGRIDLLEFEITETALMEDPARSQETLARVRDLGIRVYIDDFGTGHSSLSYIATLPTHALKIDRSFVVKILEQEQHRAVVRAAVSLAKSLGLKVVAEGVETADQAAAAMRLGCDELQGYFFSRPLPADEFQRWRASFAWKRPGLNSPNEG
jgi:diguanylate cyclase (GGDEF)-like protein/PAS domain S-box-containing protein